MAASRPLQGLVGAQLGGGSAVITSSVAILGDSVVLGGTSDGCVLAFQRHGGCTIDSTWSLCWVEAMHHGGVYSLDVSPTHCVATAGHDATCCVFPLDLIFSTPGTRQHCVRRLGGHSLPIIALQFMTDGRTLATLSAGGDLLVLDTITGARICQVSCNLAATTLALSLDETCAYVGGTHLYRVDLFNSSRPLHLVGTETDRQHESAPWLRPYSWSKAEGDEQCFATEADCLIRQIHVNVLDGTVTATFAKREMSSGALRDTHMASWHQTSARFWASTSYTIIDAAVCKGERDICAGVATAAARISSSGAGSTLQRGAALWPSSRTPYRAQHDANALTQVAWVDCRSAVSEVPLAAADHIVRDVPLTLSEKLAAERAREADLQEECNKLMASLKEVLAASKGAKKKRKSKVSA